MPMAHNNIARKAYSAEQLLALRHSASDETAIQIEAKAQDGAIKGALISLRSASQFQLLALLSFIITHHTFSFHLITVKNTRFSALSMHSFIQPTLYIHYHAFFPYAAKDKPIIQSFLFSSREICESLGGRHTITFPTQLLCRTGLANRRSCRPCCP